MRPTLSLASRLRIPEGILSHDLQGELVILNLNTGVYFGLDPVGTRIWHLIHEHGQLQHIRDALLDEYEVAEDQCTSDLLKLTAQMQENQLLEVVE